MCENICLSICKFALGQPQSTVPDSHLTMLNVHNVSAGCWRQQEQQQQQQQRDQQKYEIKLTVRQAALGSQTKQSSPKISATAHAHIYTYMFVTLYLYAYSRHIYSYI